MRTLQRNKQDLKYALYLGKLQKQKIDKNGNIVKVGDKKDTYSEPRPFKGNIALSGGDSEAAEFGLDLSDYDAKIILEKNLYPIKEGSLIWMDSEPVVDEDGHSLLTSADYRVVKKKPSLNVDRFVLKRLVNEETN